VAGIKFARRLAATAPLADLVESEFLPGGANADADDDLLAFAQQHGATIFHPAGTCRMGPSSDAHGVVDPRLRVRGVANLWVADCSVMPRLVSGNTNLPTIMIAEKAADLIQEDVDQV
jgi:choline dehydrogenase